MFFLRSVHNVRIERLWRDVTQGFGLKWYNFFHDLEVDCGLSPDIDSHIWLLHHLFLPAIDQDASDWAAAWNDHKMRFDGPERERSPRDMFFFGTLQEGLRGPDGVFDAARTLIRPEGDIEDMANYGVDWQDLANTDLLQHHNTHNPDQVEQVGQYNSRQPPHLSLVEVPAFECPFTTQEQADIFNEALISMPEYGSRNMESRKSLWRQALDLLLTLLHMSG